MLSLQKQRIWQFIQGHQRLNVTLCHAIVMTTLIAVVFACAFGPSLAHVFAQMNCMSGDTPYAVENGDTLSAIATRNQTTWQELAQRNNLANANRIYPGQTICLPGKTSGQSTDQQTQSLQLPVQLTDGQATGITAKPIKGSGNYFPYGQCTWWANQRFYQMHHVYVPWTSNSDAWRWTIQARNFHWAISTKPSVGAIIDLQPWVQGAYGLGHVAIVEQVLPNRHVIASNMNWGGSRSIVYVNFVPGRGVTFIRF